MILIANSADARIMKWAERTSVSGVPGSRVPTLTDLQNYGRLCGLARRQNNRIEEAKSLLYPVRTALEGRLIRKMRTQFLDGSRPQKNAILSKLFKGDVFGRSSKQGVSFRLPLLSCSPTALCKVGCYAHDGRDAAPQTVVRGAYNGLIAQLYETGSLSDQDLIMTLMRPKATLAVKHALFETQQVAKAGFIRRPRIRFSHVGDIACYPRFANTVAHWCMQEAWANPYLFPKFADHRLHCVTYTRRAEAKELDPNFWKVLFTIDSSSTNRESWIPSFAKKAWSGFGGNVSCSAYVNFLEHHGMVRSKKVFYNGNDILSGKAKKTFICPSTLMEHPHGCDNNRCERCFV